MLHGDPGFDAIEGVHKSAQLVWNTSTLQWEKQTSSGGGGGAATIADGADVNAGATTDAAVVSDLDATLSSKLRGLVSIFGDVWRSASHVLDVRATFTAGASLSVGNVVSITFGGTVPVSGSVGRTWTLSSATDSISAGGTMGRTWTLSYGTDAMQALGNVAHDAVDSGNPVKVGGKALLNSADLPTATASNDRVDFMADEYGRQRIIQNRPKLSGAYYVHSRLLSISFGANTTTGGLVWLVNPTNSTLSGFVKKWRAQFTPTAVTAFASAPRVTVERFTFTGAPTGTTFTAALRWSNDAAPQLTCRGANTGMTITPGATIAAWFTPIVLTAVGVSMPVEQLTFDQHDDDDLLILRPGEGIVSRQADAGTALDTRKLMIDGEWEER
jgi:hypothetical protein